MTAARSGQAPALVGLVGFGGFTSDDRRTEICETVPEGEPTVVGLGGFGGCLAVNGAHKISTDAESSESDVVGLVPIGGFLAANRPSTIDPHVDSSNAAVVGLVGFGGFPPADGASTFCADTGLTDADKALATAARGILQTLESAGLTLAVTDAGALQVSPASTLRPDQRVAIRDHRAGLVALLRMRGARFVDDERHRCSDCVHLQRKGYCAMAQKGLMPGVNPWFMPAPNVLQHCHFFHPNAVELGAP
ncbi:hypothetical protein [Acidovorax sp. Leaf73]|uniref:hypothetical protein n=1 Tax=Acidovorax sp. Leaf73 TaxID=2876566 RepID=UPI001E5DB50D|nr:hypothetical protein [Acidovorax sp. Leaf73]